MVDSACGAFSHRATHDSYMEQVGEEYTFEGLPLRELLAQHGESLTSMLQAHRDRSRAAHGNMAHILIASDMSNPDSRLFPTARLYVLNTDATRVNHAETYGKSPPHMGLALIPETSRGSHGHFELVDVAAMEALVTAACKAQSVGGNAATLSAGSTPAEAGAASVTDTDQTQVAAKIVVGKINWTFMNNVIYKTLLDELLVRSPRDKGQGITATFARRDAKLIDENKSTPDRTVFLSATVYFLDLSKDTYAHFRVCVCVCCVWCVCASGARW